MNKRKLLLAALGLASLFTVIQFSGCIKKVGKQPVVLPPPGFCDTITYNKHVKKIIDDNCVSCHQPSNTSGSTLLTNYLEVKAKGTEGRIKARAIDDNGSTRMPQPPLPPLTQTQKDIVTCWLNNGMKE
ncbi:MAG: hypothetical protein V4635_08385 [Bacteroidota bacterium]